MAYASVQAWTTQRTTTGTTAVKAFVNVPTTGNLLVCCIGGASFLTVSTVTDDIGDGVSWSAGGAHNAGTNTSTDLNMYYKVVGTPSGGGKTVTVTMSGSGIKMIAIKELSGNASSSLIDGTPLAVSGSSANFSIGSITLTDASYVVGFVQNNDGSNPTAGSGFGNLTAMAVDGAGALEDMVGVAGSQTVAFTHAASDTWDGIAVAFKPAAAGGGATPRMLTLLGTGK